MTYEDISPPTIIFPEMLDNSIDILCVESSLDRFTEVLSDIEVRRLSWWRRF